MGVVGVAASAAAALVVPPLAPIILAAGGATAVGSVGLAALRSLPPLGESPGAVKGKRITLEDLRIVDPPLPTFGIVGPSLVGKSTLLDHVRLQPVTDERTDSVYAVVVGLPAPNLFAAILDGAGSEFAQQFEIAEIASVLVVVLDHNGSDEGTAIKRQRLEEHEDFLEQLRAFLAKGDGVKKARLHFLLNKEDLWSGSSEESKLRVWFEKQVSFWESANFARSVTSRSHSNKNPDDITAFVQSMVRSLTR